jgi:hypothetical protein
MQSSFSECALLKKAEFKNFGSINLSFQKCSEITEIILPDGIVALTGSFSDCMQLKKVTLPKSVTYSDASFANCMFLEDIYYEGTIAEWQIIHLKNVSGTTIIHCADGDIKLGAN